MTTVRLWTDADAEREPRVEAVFADIRATRKSPFLNIPLARRTMPYDAMCGLFRAAVADRLPAEQAALLFGTAARIYGLHSGEMHG